MNSEDRLVNSIGINAKRNKIKIKNYTINYIESGVGNPLLLIHGANIGWGAWFTNIKDLSERYKVYALDLPGCGESTKVTYSKCQLNDDYVYVVKDFIKLNKLEGASIIGHSFGAWIAVKLALDKELKIKKLILASPLGFTDYIPGKYKLVSVYPIAKFLSNVVAKPTKESMYNFLASVLSKKTVLTEDFVEYYYRSVIREKVTHPLMFMNSLSKRFKMRSELNLLNELTYFEVPTLVILGKNDPLIPLYKVYDKFKVIKNLQLEIFEDVGHAPPIEESEKFNNLAVSFLGS